MFIVVIEYLNGKTKKLKFTTFEQAIQEQQKQQKEQTKNNIKSAYILTSLQDLFN